MGERREDDLSAIAWPGFVDILSAVIIMFVFFLMIVATTLFFHIIIFKSKIQSQAGIAAETVETEEQKYLTQVQTQFAESEEQSAEFDSQARQMTIFFGGDSISVNTATLDKVRGFIDKFKSNNDIDDYIVRIKAAKNSGTYEVAARKVALARMLNVRNFITQAGFSPKAVDPEIVPGETINDTEHWVRIIFEKKDPG